MVLRIWIIVPGLDHLNGYGQIAVRQSRRRRKSRDLICYACKCAAHHNASMVKGGEVHTYLRIIVANGAIGVAARAALIVEVVHYRRDIAVLAIGTNGGIYGRNEPPLPAGGKIGRGEEALIIIDKYIAAVPIRIIADGDIKRECVADLRICQICRRTAVCDGHDNVAICNGDVDILAAHGA